jgi:Ca2+-binding EF-hand superfamily protein
MNEIITNMIDCKFENKVQEGILSMICHRTINREDLENLEQAFLTIDTDFDGLISFQEFKAAYD